MRVFLGTVLSVIAVGVLLIAYGLLTPRTPIAAAYPEARPMFASQRVGLIDDGYPVPQPAMYSYAPRPAMAYPISDLRALPDSDGYVAPRRVASPQVVTTSVPRRTTVVERAPSRSWQKTAMVIGGSSAAAAGLGAIFGGKKGALIGAAIGGGAGTIYEMKQRK
jgi:hypothetical protein